MMAEPWGVSSRFDLVRGALSESASAASFQALQFFGLAEGDTRDRCDATSYSTPSVFVQTDVDAAFGQVELARGNPLLAALSGILAVIEANPNPLAKSPARNNVLVLVLASPPDECVGPEPLAEVAKLISDAKLRMRELEIAIVQVGDALDVTPLGRAADTLPFRISADGASERLARTFRHALGSCAGIPRFECNYAFDVPPAPDGQSFDLEQIQVTTRPPEGGFEASPRLSGPEACATSQHGGFYVDQVSNPTQLRLCPCSCARFAWGSPSIEFLCEPSL